MCPPISGLSVTYVVSLYNMVRSSRCPEMNFAVNKTEVKLNSVWLPTCLAFNRLEKCYCVSLPSMCMCVCLFLRLSNTQLHTSHIDMACFREQQGEKLCEKP